MTNFPPKLQEIAEHIGEEAALQLADLFGGSRLWISNKEIPSDHPINQMPPESIARLQREYGGQYVFVPKAKSFRVAQRNQLMLAARSAGMSMRQIALEFSVNERDVYRIFKSLTAVV